MPLAETVDPDQPPKVFYEFAVTAACSATFRGAIATRPPPVRASLLERIPSPVTVASDLRKRRFAQRLALDT